MEPYVISEPKGSAVPILVSVPHSGTEFPNGTIQSFHPDLANAPAVDTEHIAEAVQFRSLERLQELVSG